jgi:hypothetical protein
MDLNGDGALSANDQRTPRSGLLRITTTLCLILAILACGILAGAVIIGFPIFHVPAELMVPFPPEEIAVAREASMRHVAMLNATVAMGVLGFLMSVLLGMGEAAARRFSEGTVVRLVVGIILATAVGCVSGVVGQFLVQLLHVPEGPLTPIVRTFLVQAGMFGLFGLGVGAALGFVAGGARTAGAVAVSGLLAGIVAAFVFPVTSAFVTPDLSTEVVMPGGVLRGQKHTLGLALYLGLLAVALGLILPFGSRGAKPKTGG